MYGGGQGLHLRIAHKLVGVDRVLGTFGYVLHPGVNFVVFQACMPKPP